MNIIVSYLIEIAVTLAAILLVMAYLRPYLRRILLDLCGTEERAQFWTAFTNLVLIGIPMLLAMTFQPEATQVEGLFFEIARKLSGNLGGFLFGLLMVGIILSFFALVTPRTKQESK